MAKHILILGCGYVGMAVAKRFLEKGWIVHALTRNEKRLAELNEIGVNTFAARLDSNDWHEWLSPDIPDLVLDCVSAAESTVDGYKASYYNGLLSLQDWYKNSSKKAKLIYTSSTSVYPQMEGEWVDEGSDVYCGDFEKTNILLESESLVKDRLSSLFSSAIVFRLAGIYGPERHYLINQIADGKLVFDGDGSSFLNLIHLSDIVQAIDIASQLPDSGFSIYNLSDDLKYTKREIAEWTAKMLKKGTPVFNGKASSTRRSFLADGKLPNRRISNAKWKQTSSWEPIYPSFKEGYMEIIDQIN